MNIPEDLDPIFREIDELLKARGLPPHARSVNATSEFAKRFGISLPLGRVPPHAPEELRRNAIYTERIEKWFADLYGERSKVDFSANARVSIIADGDIWEMRIPLIYGTVHIAPSRALNDSENIISQDPIVVNPCASLTHITPARLAHFSDADLNEIFGMFCVGLEVRQIFDRFRDAHSKFVEAESDWSVAVMHLTAQTPNYGQSRWASLQLAEKFMKGLVAIIGDVEVNRVHVLKELHDALAISIPSLNLNHLLHDIQCSAEVRYGETLSTREQAYAAHKASLLLVRALGSVKSGN